MAAELRFIVRTVPGAADRAANVERMREQLPELEVLVDHDRDAYRSYERACERIAETGGVLLEDDALLCRDFRARVEAVIREVGPDHVINFFERPKSYFPAGFVGGSLFMWTQCVYLPGGFAGRVFSYYEQFHTERPKKAAGMAYDLLIGYALVKEKRRYYRHRPTLVQHLPFPSVIGPRPTNRQTPYFIDDLAAQGVPYDDLRPAE